MIRRIVDATESDSQMNRTPRGLLVLGNRAELASQLEQSLLQAGALVLRTRVPVSTSLVAIARLGAFVLVESDEPAPITLTSTHVASVTPRELAFDQPDEILNEIQRLSTIPTGEDVNNDGLGI